VKTTVFSSVKIRGTHIYLCCKTLKRIRFL